MCVCVCVGRGSSLKIYDVQHSSSIPCSFNALRIEKKKKKVANFFFQKLKEGALLMIQKIWNKNKSHTGRMGTPMHKVDLPERAGSVISISITK